MLANWLVVRLAPAGLCNACVALTHSTAHHVHTNGHAQVDLQPRVGTSSTGISREAFISNVARDIAGKIPEPFDTQLLKKSIGIPSPTQVVLLQETERWNKVSFSATYVKPTKLAAENIYNSTMVCP